MMNTSPIEEGQQSSFSSTPLAAREERQQVGELVGVPVATAEHNPSLEQSPHRYSGVVEFVSNLWNSVPPFIITGEKARYTEERRRFAEENNSTYNQLGLEQEYNRVLNAYDAVIALPAFGYHRNASQAYGALRAALYNAQIALTTARNRAAIRNRAPLIGERILEEVSLFHNSAPNTPGAHHIRRIRAF